VTAYFGAPAHLRRSPAQDLSAQERCDAIQAEYRSAPPRPSIRREAPPLPPALVATDDQLMLSLAEELEYVRRMIEIMGDTLCADPIVVGRHMTALQTVDIAGQILGHVAKVVRSSDPAGAVENIGMCDLKGRLKKQALP
jgi:hypothetical protein